MGDIFFCGDYTFTPLPGKSRSEPLHWPLNGDSIIPRRHQCVQSICAYICYMALICRDPPPSPPPWSRAVCSPHCADHVPVSKRSMNGISKTWLSRALGYQFMIKALRPRIARGIEATVREADKIGKFRTKQSVARSVRWGRRGLAHCVRSCFRV